MNKLLLTISSVLLTGLVGVNAQCNVKLSADKTKFCSDDKATLSATPSSLTGLPDYSDSKQVFNVADLKLDQQTVNLIKAGVFNGISYPLNKSNGDFTLALNGYQLKNTVITSGSIDVSIITDLKQDLKFVFELPYFKINGKSIKDSIQVTGANAGTGKQTFTKSFDLKNAVVDFSVGDPSKYNIVRYAVSPTIKISTTTFNNTETGDLKIELKSIQFTENITFNWFKDGVNVSNNNYPSLEVNESGKYLVETTSNCGTAKDSVEIEVVQMPTKEVTTVGNLTFCEGDSVNLEAKGIGSYNWSNNETSNATTIKKSGDYSVTVTNDICSITSDIIKVNVNENPTVNLNHADTTIIIGTSLTLKASGAKDYLWNDKSTLDSLKIDEAGTYTVTGTNEAGCSTSASIKVEVREKGASLSSLNKIQLTLLPNPVSEVLTVKVDNFKSKNVNIIDLKGNVILSKKLTNALTEISVNSFAKGTYLVTITNESNTILSTDRIVIE
jgi:hypothetical protein